MNLETTNCEPWPSQVALVTGAAGGIGRAVCSLLAEHGAKLVLTDVVPEALERVTAELTERGAVARAGRCDACSVSDLEGLVHQAEGELGPLTMAINCAGVFKIVPFEELTEADWHTILQANLNSAFASARVVAPRLRRRGGGSIVNFASTAGEEGSFRPAAHYAAAKAAVIGLSKSLAREYGPYGVRVNVISPGPVDTPMLAADTPEKRAAAGARTLLGRVGTPQEIAAAAVFLAGPDSGFVTGHVMRVNGGSLL